MPDVVNKLRRLVAHVQGPLTPAPTPASGLFRLGSDNSLTTSMTSSQQIDINAFNQLSACHAATHANGYVVNSGQIWYEWTASTWTTPALSDQQGIAWVQWQQAGTSDATNITITSRQPYVPPSAAQIAANQEHARLAVAARDLARKRAEDLLHACLSEMQQKQLKAVNYFEVRSSRGTTYRVYRGQAGNVVRLEAGREVERFCIHPRQHSVPNEDAMLIQKLMIETEEERFIAIANKTRLSA